MKLFSGAISHGVSNEPEVYLELSQTSLRELFTEIVNDCKSLTIFAKKLDHRCSTWF